jgi:phosphate starvation-inducible PhoH-like protein
VPFSYKKALFFRGGLDLPEQEIIIDLNDNQTAQMLYGANDEYLNIVRENVPVEIVAKSNQIIITGNKEDVGLAERIFRHLINLVENNRVISLTDIDYAILMKEENREISNLLKEVVYMTVRGKKIMAKTKGQYEYIENIKKKDVVFGIGPAGTGKTYLAVVMAVKYLRDKKVSRIVLTRPAVEAGEQLGFLPGDLQEKIDPYLRPLYDGLYDVLGLDLALKYIEKGIIEIAPLAYMRGRTLEDCFIILDEAQNTTPEQMKMFLTRIGLNSKVVVTGDITQVDLPKNSESGLILIQNILKDIEEIGFSYLKSTDVVRHKVVRKIIEAYDKYYKSF